MYIYKITNLVNNKIYIGQTISKDPMLRWQRHKSNAKLKTYSTPLYNSINKYGFKNFKFELLCYAFSIESLNILEEYFIKYFNSTNLDIGYNLMTGGGNKRHSESSILKIKESKKNISLETRQKMSISQKNSGRIPWNKGKNIINPPATLETRKKISAGLKDKPKSEQHKHNLSIAKKEYHKTHIHCQAKSIICLNTNQIFESVQKAANFYQCKNAHIARVCRKERKSFKGLIFEFLENT